MKQTNSFLLIAVAAALPLVSNAQPVEVRGINGDVLNGTTIQLVNAIGGDLQVLGMPAAVENISGVERMVNVKRYEIDVPHATGNYFCWSLCYSERAAGASPLWVAADPITMAPGYTTNGFHAYYMPHGFVGQALFRYVWFDVNNPNDSVWVDINFNATPTGIAENTSPVLNFEVFPNPSTASDITLNYDLATAAPGTRLALYNVLGERKLVRAIATAKGQVVLHESELGSGVWFAVLERNGKPLATKRVVVLR